MFKFKKSMKGTLQFLLTLAITVTTSQAQIIPNAGFENWTSMGAYSDPTGWDQLNSLTSLFQVFTCEQGSPGNVGSYFLKLTSKTVPGAGIVPGVAVSGIIDVPTQQPKSGFVFTAQPQALTGKWQHMIFGNSQGFVDVKLTRWDSSTNSRITVASGHIDLTGMAMSWANFSVPMAYLETTSPDSCIITLSASGSNPTNNDYLWVDDLSFTGSVTSMSVIDEENAIKLFPNPSNSLLSIDMISLNEPATQIMIFDSKGNYVINVISNKGLISKKFIKN